MKEISVIVCFLMLIFASAAGLVAASCADYKTQTGKETKSSWASCYIKHNNEWFLWEEYKLRNITAGATK